MTRTSSMLPSRATAGDSRRTRSSFPRAALTSRSCSRLENHFLPAPHLRHIPPPPSLPRHPSSPSRPLPVAVRPPASLLLLPLASLPPSLPPGVSSPLSTVPHSPPVCRARARSCVCATGACRVT